MKKVWVIFAAWGWCQVVIAQGITTFKFSQTELNIFSGAPPALVYVTDSKGRRTGADPTQSITSNGYQDSPPTGLMEIPSSMVLQDRLENGSGTGWTVSIGDGGTQTYTINILGMVAGDEEIGVSAVILNNPDLALKAAKNIFVFVSPSQLRKLTLTFDPIQGTANVTRLVSGGDLLIDVQTACQLNLITSSRVCKQMEGVAEAIQNALSANRKSEANELLKRFLYMLGDSRPDGCLDKDDHGSITKTALTILIEDAKALLKSLGFPEGFQH